MLLVQSTEYFSREASPPVSPSGLGQMQGLCGGVLLIGGQGCNESLRRDADAWPLTLALDSISFWCFWSFGVFGRVS